MNDPTVPAAISFVVLMGKGALYLLAALSIGCVIYFGVVFVRDSLRERRDIPRKHIHTEADE
jgi:hypothetical protein